MIIMVVSPGRKRGRKELRLAQKKEVRETLPPVFTKKQSRENIASAISQIKWGGWPKGFKKGRSLLSFRARRKALSFRNRAIKDVWAKIKFDKKKMKPVSARDIDRLIQLKADPSFLFKCYGTVEQLMRYSMRDLLKSRNNIYYWLFAFAKPKIYGLRGWPARPEKIYAYLRREGFEAKWARWLTVAVKKEKKDLEYPPI